MMLWSACLLLLWSRWVSAEPLPTGQVESVLLKAASSAEQELAQPRKLPDISKRFSSVLFGFIPIELGIQARNITQVGPLHILLRDPLRGEKSQDGKSLLLEAKVHVKDTSVIYNYLLIDIFGYKYEGTGTLWRYSSTADLTLQFHPENVVQGCSKTTAVVSQPRGPVFLTLGSERSTADLIFHTLEFLANLVNNHFFHNFFNTDLVEFLFPDEQDTIMEAFNNFKLDC